MLEAFAFAGRGQPCFALSVLPLVNEDLWVLLPGYTQSRTRIVTGPLSRGGNGKGFLLTSATVALVQPGLCVTANQFHKQKWEPCWHVLVRQPL